MDRALVERMVGAVVLVLLLVIIAPALLDGSADSNGARQAGSSRDAANSTQVIILNAPVNAQSNTPASAPEPAPAPAPAPAPEPVRQTKDAQTKDSAAPVSQAVSKPKQKPPPQGFGVQLGSFSAKANATRYASEVKAQGFDVFVVRASAAGAAVYRVYGGPESSRDRAGDLAGRLKAAGHSVMVVELGG